MMSKILRTIMGFLLLPVAIGTAKAFYVAISGISIYSGMLNILERGVLFYLLFHVLIIRPVYLYVLGHEVVHVVATWICGGSIVSFNVMPSGGNVVTSKSNVFIELSPYFVPIYTVLLGPAFLILKWIGIEIPFMSIIFIFLVGFTLAFHFVMTSDALRLRQPDIIKSGVLFSLVFILVANLVVIMIVFCPFFSDLSFADFIKASWSNTTGIYRMAYARAIEIFSSA